MTRRKKIFRIIAAVSSLVAIGCAFLGILFGFGAVRFVPGQGFMLDTNLFWALRSQWWFVLAFVVVQALATTLLSFVPATSMMFILGAVALFGASWTTFLLELGCVVLSSLLMDLVGRLGGKRLIVALVGEEDYEKAYRLVNEKGLVYIPFMYLLPLFPDDAICMVAGSMRIKWWLHLIYIALCRGIGCATIVFGISIVPFDKFANIYDWLVFITVCAFWVVAILRICKWLNGKLEKIRLRNAQSVEWERPEELPYELVRLGLCESASYIPSLDCYEITVGGKRKSVSRYDAMHCHKYIEFKKLIRKGR